MSPRARRNPRFDEQVGLEAAEAAANYVQRGDSGMEVRILQQGLIDAGYPLPDHGVDGTFGAETDAAVRQLQGDHAIRNDGVVGPDTMQALHAVHDRHESVVAIARNQDPANPVEGTRALTVEETAAFNEAIVTEPRTSSGALPTFERTTAAGDYETRVRARLSRIISRMHADAAAKAANRGDPDALHDWGSIEDVAAASKDETDRVFGSYSTGPAFRQGVNLFDAWEEESDAIAHDPGYADYIVEDLAGYLLDNYMNDLNEEHGAVASRAAERAILDGIKSDYVASHRSQLLEIQKAWPGLASGGEISIQRYRASDDAGNREFMWDQFATIIHEYIHTLEHDDYSRYIATMAEQRGGLTLREGMCDYFTKMVWDTVAFTPALRRTVEGPYHDATSHPIPQPSVYDSIVEAERAVGIIGVRNAMAAFFLGRTDFIGGP